MHSSGNGKLPLVKELRTPIVYPTTVVTQVLSLRQPSDDRAFESTLNVDNHVVVSGPQTLEQSLEFSALKRSAPVFSPAAQGGGKDILHMRMPPGNMSKRFVHDPVEFYLRDCFGCIGECWERLH